LIPFRLQLLTKKAKATQTTSCFKAPGFWNTLLSNGFAQLTSLSGGMAKPDSPPNYFGSARVRIARLNIDRTIS
jgi:hypothetical protein